MCRYNFKKEAALLEEALDQACIYLENFMGVEKSKSSWKKKFIKQAMNKEKYKA